MPMLKYLSPDEQIRFSELQARLALFAITESEQKEVSVLVLKAQKTAAERGAVIESVRKLIADNGIGVSAVFSAEEIQRAAASIFGTGKGPRKQGAATEKVAKTKPTGGDVVLIQVKLDKAAGAPSRYKKGQKLGKFVSKNFKQLDTDGTLVENLLHYATPLGKAYFATEEGKTELATFARYVQETPVNG
jgi:hypothetical protein